MHFVVPFIDDSAVILMCSGPKTPYHGLFEFYRKIGLI